jgi:hypothetical protein
MWVASSVPIDFAQMRLFAAMEKLVVKALVEETTCAISVACGYVRRPYEHPDKVKSSTEGGCVANQRQV